MLGIPVILANHGGSFGTPILGIPFTKLPSPFMGMSQIVQAGGDTVAEAGTEAGVVLVGEITVQARVGFATVTFASDQSQHPSIHACVSTSSLTAQTSRDKLS